MAGGPEPTEQELRRLLDTVSPGAMVGPGAEMPAAVLEGLAELIPCAGIEFFELDPSRGVLGPTQLLSFADLAAEDVDGQGLFRRAWPEGTT